MHLENFQVFIICVTTIIRDCLKDDSHIYLQRKSINKMNYVLKKVMSWGRYLLFSLIISITKWTPFFILYTISSLVSKLLLHIKKIPTNEIAQRNLRRAFPEKTHNEVRELCRKYYEGFCDYLIEFVKRTRFSDEKMKQHCRFKNLELLTEIFKTHQFVICYGGHMLNFEWQVSLPLHMPEYGMCHLYLSGESGKEMDWVLKVRSQYGAINIPSSSPLKTLLKLKEDLSTGTDKHKGYIFGTLADMDTTADNPHVSSFFNHNLEMLTGSERIGRKMNMAFVYAHMSRPKRGYYVIDFKEMSPTDIETNPFAYTDEFVRLLENNIREKPELWMQWGECRF